MTGGFAEVSPAAATILAESAVLRAELDGGLVSDLLAAAERDLADAPDDRRMAAGQRVRESHRQPDGPQLSALSRLGWRGSLQSLTQRSSRPASGSSSSLP